MQVRGFAGLHHCITHEAWWGVEEVECVHHGPQVLAASRWQPLQDLNLLFSHHHAWSAEMALSQPQPHHHHHHHHHSFTSSQFLQLFSWLLSADFSGPISCSQQEDAPVLPPRKHIISAHFLQIDSFYVLVYKWVVSNIFCVHPYLGKWSNLTNIFQMGWNHRLDHVPCVFLHIFFCTKNSDPPKKILGHFQVMPVPVDGCDEWWGCLGWFGWNQPRPMSTG